MTFGEFLKTDLPTVPRPPRLKRGRDFLGTVETLEGRTLATSSFRFDVPHLIPHANIVPTSSPTSNGRALMNLVYRNDRGRVEHLDLYLPNGPIPTGGYPVILGLAGGGWRWVRRSSLGDSLSSFTKDGYAVAVADYAFASNKVGTSVWPTDLQDVQHALWWLRSKSARFGINPDKIAVWGESAGGNLASLLGTASGAPGADPNTKVQAVVDFYGPTELTQLYQDSPGTRPYLMTFLGGTPDQAAARYQAASPADNVSANDPPFFIAQGAIDPTVPESQSQVLYQALQVAGVPVKADFLQGQPHGFRLNVGFDLRGEILTFLSQALNGQTISTGKFTP